MSPASGPVQNPKMYPAAVMEDQEEIMAGEQPASFVSTPPFSSPDPETDALRMEIVDSDVSAYDAREGEQPETTEDPSEMKAADFKAKVEAAKTQEELDAAAQLYTDSEKDFSSVEAAIEKKQEEIDEADEDSDES